MNLRKKRVLKRNDYRQINENQCVMPSGTLIANIPSMNLVYIQYPCGTQRWISNDFYSSTLV